MQGIDLARGIAVIGMLAAHLVYLAEWDWRDPGTWTDVANGRSSILFATLAGVSIALVTGGASRPAPGRELGRARRALALRALLLWLIGLVLIATQVPAFIILPTYAVLFLLALPLLRLRARTLWIVAAGLAATMPWIEPLLDGLPVWRGEQGAMLMLVAGWHYPFPVWAVFVVAGLAAGRSGLGRPRTAWTLLAAGAALAALAYGADALRTALHPAGGRSYLDAALAARPHSGGLLEVFGGGGLALAAIGLCLLLCRVRPVGAVLLPLRAVGSMPLTAYVGQIIAWVLVAALVLGDVRDLQGMRNLQPFWPFAGATIMFCTAWGLRWGRGPVERLLAWVTRWVLPR
ncbi:heparan-alpha-glucosaminide N-acetyltransferase domain-containing protein [Microbacterium dextranolyticum]|uniref:DUF1624 domain-containing protein n=1 Tax=Microbacterium dextranolyticum TaxID=36806 RepID=A0A9W6M6P8_9MICO|nr:heparan-alpha-glucosaminide N-acetyltransferase domain-containing protein [Microbacterium dextranolyticum]MBM7462463.1 putative membrane protein YeiB [Microbacterium dextranolyticum]GLJ96704.1 hypothetical protein GCM10017591_27670 [Microbacterium dextranolyticum]